MKIKETLTNMEITTPYILLKFGLLKLKFFHRKNLSDLYSAHIEDVGFVPLDKLYSEKEIGKIFENFNILSIEKLHIPKRYPLSARILFLFQSVLGFYFIIKGLRIEAAQ